MAALVTIQNDGPDAADIRVGKTSRVLYAGQSMRIATSMTVDVGAVPNISDSEMSMHMGGGMKMSDPCRHVEDD